MKNFMTILPFWAFCTFSFISVNAQNNMDSVSYSLGVLIAQNLKQQGITKVDPASVAKGVADMLNGQPAMDIDVCNQIVQQEMESSQSKQYLPMIEAGKKFLADNATREGVTVLPSGLQYEVMKKGDGPQPVKTDKVTVHYHGTLMDGTVFDSSVQRGSPATFGVTQVIQGWVEALQLMHVGDKWKLFIPYNLAYGSRSAGAKIGPYSTLVFEVELIKIN